MVFQVKDPAMLDQVKAGDKIRFQADKIGGQYTVTRINRSKTSEFTPRPAPPCPHMVHWPPALISAIGLPVDRNQKGARRAWEHDQ